MAENETRLPTIDIKGEEYVTVNERLRYFRTAYPEYRLTTEICGTGNDWITMVARISDASGNVVATGHAHEEKQSSFINKTSYVENCETSAWGRALANFGIGIDAEVCSADELANALMNQGGKKEPPRKAEASSKGKTPERNPDISSEMIGELLALAQSVGKTPEAIMNYYSVGNLYHLSTKQYNSIMEMLNAKAEKLAHKKMDEMLDGDAE